MTNDKTRIIPLTHARPVKIRDSAWPVIAYGSWEEWDNEYEFQANRKWNLRMRVRERADGRALVYGAYEFTSVWQGERDYHAERGELVPAGADVIAAIRRVAADLGATHGDAAEHAGEVAQDCIAALPALEL